MVTISYSTIYSRFLSRVEAYELADMVETNAYEMLEEWLKSVKSNPRFRKLFKSITLDSEIQTITAELKNSQGDEETDVDFIVELFSVGIAWKWVSPKYLSTLNASQMISGSKVNFYSQAQHLSELAHMYKNTETEFYGMIRDYGTLYNSYLNSDE